MRLKGRTPILDSRSLAEAAAAVEAGFAVAFCGLTGVGESLNKGMLRVFGTLFGATVGLNGYLASGTPITGRTVRAAAAPARWLAMPAQAMTTFTPCLSASSTSRARRPTSPATSFHRLVRESELWSRSASDLAEFSAPANITSLIGQR